MDKFTQKAKITSATPVEGAHSLARVDLWNDTCDTWNQHQILCSLEFLFQSLDAYYQVNRKTSVPASFTSKEQRVWSLSYSTKVNESSLKEAYQEICSWPQLKHISRCVFDLVVQYCAYLYQKLGGKWGLLHVLCTCLLYCYQPVLPICSFLAGKLLEES